MIQLDRFAQRWHGRAERLPLGKEGKAASTQEWVGIAPSGESWNIGPFRLWRSIDPATVLYVSHEPLLDCEDGTRYCATVTRINRCQGSRTEAVGGLARLRLTLSPQLGPSTVVELRNHWREIALGGGYSGDDHPKFLPLPTRGWEVKLDLDPSLGKVMAGVPGDSVVVDLTAQGIERWAQALDGTAVVPGTVQLTYRYLRLLPEASGCVTIHGIRLFTHLHRLLHLDEDGYLRGTAEEIGHAWLSAARAGAIDAELSGTCSREAWACREELLDEFVRSARDQLFEPLFTPVIGTENGSGAVYRLRWRSLASVMDYELSLRVEGWTWIPVTAVTSLDRVLSPLDSTYLETGRSRDLHTEN